MDSEKKKHFIGFSEVIFAAVAALIYTIGRCVYVSHSIFVLPSVLKEYALLFVVLFIPFLFIFALAGKGVTGRSGERSVYSDKLMWLIPALSSLLIAAACVIVCLCLGPVYLMGDMYTARIQERYPLIHTLLRQLFHYTVSAGYGESAGSTVFLIFLSLILGSACGYVVRREMAEGFRKLPLVLTILYFAVLVPFLALDSMHTEESLFFCAIIMLFTCLTKGDKDEKKGVFFIWLFLVLACLLRYNFIPAAFVLFLSLLLKVKKGTKNSILASLAGIITVIAVILAFFYGFGLREIREKDMMSIPVSQVAAVYVHHEPDLTIAEKFIIENYMNAKDYAPRNSRIILDSFNEGLYLSDRSAFWDLYMHLAEKYPYDLIDAFLNANTGIWQPGSAGIPLFVVLLGLYIALKSKRPGYSAGIAAVFVLWLTYLFGPEYRHYYMDSFGMLIPAVLIPVFSAKTVTDEASEENGEDTDDGILDDDELTKEIEKMESEEKKEDTKKEADKKENAKKDLAKKDKEEKESEKKEAEKKDLKEKGADKKESEEKTKEEKEPGTKEAKKEESVKKDSEEKESEKKEAEEKESEIKGSEEKDTGKKESEEKAESGEKPDSGKNGGEEEKKSE
ncbi:MAG: hypothetical protein J6U50_09450 [Lachnospiraceae bacterium]|nr:hypothetical protein [Lachnospiraceae bacterium]